MRTRTDLHKYQVKTVKHIVEHEHAMLHLEMGLGKTVSALTAVSDLLESFQIKSVLVVAPLRVCQTVWRQEAKKWDHTKWLRFSLIHGDADQRKRAVRRKGVDIYLINYENLQWLQQYLEATYLRRGQYLPFDAIIFDEISKLKNARIRQGAERGRAVMKLLPFIRRRIGLTGTPASNGLLDLFGQYLVVDSGSRLGTSFEAYRSQYFYQTDRRGYRWRPHQGSDEKIAGLIGDITVSMRAEDYLEMPSLIVNDILLDFPQDMQEAYDAIERDMIVELKSGGQVEVFNQASLINRCLQFANGAIYVEPESRDWEKIHDIKLDALEDVVEEMAGAPLLVAFQFQHDAKRIQKRFKGAKWFNASLSEKEAIKMVEDFKEGKIPILLGHPASMGHGLDGLQGSCNNIALFGLNWSLDLMQQTTARLWRQGQTKPVFVHRLLMNNTTDLAVDEALKIKASDETSIKNAVMTYWRKKSV